MLRSLKAKQFFEWMAFDELEPFGEVRDDYRAASIVQMVHNVAVKREHAKKIDEFLLRFGERTRRQDWREQKALFLMMVAGTTGEKELNG